MSRGSKNNKTMKAVINRKRYDTDTATEIASWSNGAYSGDFNRCEETLYVTKAGNYFLHGEGGALSKYARSCEGGRSRGGGSAITPMTRDEAIEWLEAHGEAEAIEKHFADAITEA
jgi:hypothetical protein